MAQLPPKVPNMALNWGGDHIHHHHKIPSGDNLPTTQPHTITDLQAPAPPSWADDFLNFSSSNKRWSHRRSASDSVAFLEIPPLMVDQEDQTLYHMRSSARGPANNAGPGAELDLCFDEEQFMSMLVDNDVGPPSNPSSPSDHNSINEDDMIVMRAVGPSDDQQPLIVSSDHQGDEESSSCSKSDGQLTPHATNNLDINSNNNDKVFDPKRIKRILANRQSAQRSRVRKLQYISELERSVNSLQAEVSILSPRVAFLDHQRLALNVDNSVLKQRIAALSQDKLFKDAHQEALKREIDRLKQVHYQQNMQKMENGAQVIKSPLSHEVNVSACT